MSNKMFAAHLGLSSVTVYVTISLHVDKQSVLLYLTPPIPFLHLIKLGVKKWLNCIFLFSVWVKFLLEKTNTSRRNVRLTNVTFEALRKA